MENSLICLQTGSTDPCYNLAFEETVLTNRTEGNYLILWQNDKTVVIGQNQNAAAEINRKFVEENGIRVVRRSTGGGAVYHDLGNLNYSFISDAGDAQTLQKEQFALPVVKALRKLGLDAELSGRNDILVSGKKVSGTAQRILGKRILYHGTLLFDSDFSMVSRALQVDPSKFRSKGIGSVRSRVGNIRTFLKVDMDMPAFWDYMKNELLEGRAAEDTLSPAELSSVKALQHSKYGSWDWTYGRSPEFEYANKEKFPGGLLEVRLSAAAGRITQIRFYGDFLSSAPLDPVQDALKGCPLQVQAVTAVLSRFPLPLYFGSIRREEIIDTLFGACGTLP